jgi:hypothetical protein
MTMNTDKDWLRKKAQQEDGCFVSAGGLVEALAEREQAPADVALRNRRLALVQFAAEVDVDLADARKD